MRDTLIYLWKVLDGNKTIICLAIGMIIEKLAEFSVIEKTPIVQFISWLFIALGSGAFVHHIQKGYFSPDKGS